MIKIINNTVYYNDEEYSILQIDTNDVHLINNNGGICVSITAEERTELMNIS